MARSNASTQHGCGCMAAPTENTTSRCRGMHAGMGHLRASACAARGAHTALQPLAHARCTTAEHTGSRRSTRAAHQPRPLPRPQLCHLCIVGLENTGQDSALAGCRPRQQPHHSCCNRSSPSGLQGAPVPGTGRRTQRHERRRTSTYKVTVAISQHSGYLQPHAATNVCSNWPCRSPRKASGHRAKLRPPSEAAQLTGGSRARSAGPAPTPHPTPAPQQTYT
jgi:hypothetical protein